MSDDTRSYRSDPRVDPTSSPPARPRESAPSLPPVLEPQRASMSPSSRGSVSPGARRTDTGSAGGALRRQLASLQMQLADFQRQMAEQQEERALDADRIADMLAAIVRLENANRAGEERIRDAETRDAEAKIAIRTLEGALTHARSELEHAQHKAGELTRQLDASRRALADSERERDQLAASKAESDELREALDTELLKTASLESKLNAERGAHTRALDQAEAKLDAAQKSVAEAEKQAKAERAAAEQAKGEARRAQDEAKAAKDAADASRKQREGMAAELAGAKAALRAAETRMDVSQRAADAARAETTSLAARVTELERVRDGQLAEIARLRQELDTAEAMTSNLRTQFQGSEEILADASTAIDRLERGELELALVRATALAAAKELVMQVAAARALVDPSRAADAMRALGRLSRNPPPPASSEIPPEVPPAPNAQDISVTVGVAEADVSEFLEEDEAREDDA